MGYYYLNSSLLCAVIIGTIAILTESVALSADIAFTGKHQYSFNLDELCHHFLTDHENNTGPRDFTLLGRDLPFEPLSLFVLSLTVVTCIASIVVTWIFRNKKLKLIMMMNKILTISITASFFGCSVLICTSFIIYDLNYIEFNYGETTGCNMNYNHEYDADKDCDQKYSLCQRKDLKAASFLLSLVCALLGISGLLRELKTKNTAKDFQDTFSHENSFPVESLGDEDTLSISVARNKSSEDISQGD
jgi:hypothetical protein